MKRRTFFHTSLATGALVTANLHGKDEAFPGIVDSNVSLFRWPFRRLPLDDTGKLVKKLRSLGVTTALAGTFEGVFQRDLAAANRRLAEESRQFPELVAVGSINLALPPWERDLELCRDELKMPGIRLHPGVHGYSLNDARFHKLLQRAGEAGLFVQLAVTLEDSRTQPEHFTYPEVDLRPLQSAVDAAPETRLQLLNLRPRKGQLKSLPQSPNLFFDTARADGTDGVAAALSEAGNDRIVFGTHAPFLIPEAAMIRVHESALAETRLRSVLRGNAVKLLGFDPS